MTDGITLGLIVKDEAKNLQRIHDAHHPELIFDEVIITDTGSTDNTAALAESFGWRVNHAPWTNHFAEARNANLAECTTRWYCWMDADDTIENIAYLPNLAKTCEGKVGAVIFPYWYALNGAGKPTTIITRERLIDLTSTQWTWKNRVHETLVPAVEVPVLLEQSCVWVHRPSPDRPESAKRNLDLLLLDLKENTADDSVYFYLGAQYLALKDYPQAIAWFKVAIERGKRPDMVWRACEYGADVLRILALNALKRGDKERHDDLVMESIDLDLRGMEIMPAWADCYFGLAESYTLAREWDKAINWHEIGLTKKECDPVINMNPFDYSYRPFVYSHIARMSLGDIEGALKDVEKALEVAPTDEDLLSYKEQYEAALYEQAVTGAALTIAGCTEDEALPTLVDALPVAVRKFKNFRENVFGRIAQIKHPGKPIIDFFCGQAPEEWGPPSLIEGGIGGSETAVIHVARLLAEKGARVRVLGNPGVYSGIFDGVEYYDWDTYHQQEKRNVLVIWRNPHVADYAWQAQRTIFWAHDLNYADGLVGVGDKLDHVCGVSRWHADYLAQTYPHLAKKVGVLRNGIDLSRYADLVNTKKDKNVIIWSSSPDRGLHYLLPMMPLWATINPDLKVHVYYGLHGLEAQAQAGDQASMMMLRNIRTLMKKFEKFVVWHGRVNQTELAKAQMAASYWFYPTRFTEVSCITALEAQAAHLQIVASDLAALPETINGGGVLVPGSPDLPVTNRVFVGEASFMITNPYGFAYRKRQNENVAAQTWARVVAEDWMPKIEDVL